MGISMWDIWERAEAGPICPVKEFETKVLFRKVQELVKKYGIKYDPASPVPTDDVMIDNIFKAGMELLVEVGVLCTDTEKLIKFDEQEVKDALTFVSKEVTLGEGRDAAIMAHRGIEDKRLPLILGGPICVPISEDIAMKAYEAYARESSVEVLYPGTLTMAGGMTTKAGSPFEMYAEKTDTARAREAFKRAGRPGVAIWAGSYTAPRGAISTCNPEWGYRKCDLVHCYIMPNMKTDYGTLCKAEHFNQYGCHIWGMGTPFVGGLVGGPEGAAIASVAESLAACFIYKTDLLVLWTPDAMYAPGMSARKPIWAASRGHAAMARHTNFPKIGCTPYQAYAGPCTDMYLYEIAAPTIAQVVCGAHPCVGGGRQGCELDYFGGPLDTRFLHDVAYAATRLNRQKANEIVKALLAKYEDRIKAKNPPVGKKFQECNDLKTLKPTKEYLNLYDKVKKELEGMGLTFFK